MKIEISLRKIKSAWNKIWNYFPNKRKQQLYNDVAKWYQVEVRDKLIENIAERKIERRSGGKIITTYRCPQCKKSFNDYGSLSSENTIECNKCVFGNPSDLSNKECFEKLARTVKVVVNPQDVITIIKIETNARVETHFQNGKVIKEVRIPIEPNRFVDNHDGKLMRDE